MGWLIALAVLIGLALLPVGFSLRYNNEDLQLRLIVGFASFSLDSVADKEKKPEQAPKKQKKKNSFSQKVKDLWDTFSVEWKILKFLRENRKDILVRLLEFKLVLTDEDPCDLAISYGRAWATVGNIIPHLERQFRIKKRKVDISCDFAGDKSHLFVRADITAPLFKALRLLYKHVAQEQQKKTATNNTTN